MQKGKGWNPCIKCIMNVIFTIQQEFGTRYNIFSIGDYGEDVRVT